MPLHPSTNPQGRAASQWPFSLSPSLSHLFCRGTRSSTHLSIWHIRDKQRDSCILTQSWDVQTFWPGLDIKGRGSAAVTASKGFSSTLPSKKKCLTDEMFPFTTYPLQASPGREALNCLIRAQITLKIPHRTINKSALASSRAPCRW